MSAADPPHSANARAAQREDFARMAADLREIAGSRPFLFVQNPGNWGDSLIREGAEQFLRHFGFSYASVRYMDLKKGRTTLSAARERTGHPAPVMLFSGGAAQDPRYNRVPYLIELSRQFDRSVFLPATLPVPVAPLGFPEGAVFYARDRYESLANAPDGRFCHDMAFFLELRGEAPTRKIGVFMRNDSERPKDAPLPLGNRDLSYMGRAHTPIDRLVRILARYETIYTNRLHIGIGAALLGREVHLYGNDYFKIRAIYDSSMREAFPNVHFSQEARLPDLPRQPWWHRFRRP